MCDVCVTVSGLCELEGRILVLSGYEGGDLNSVEEYEPASDSWKAAPSMMENRSHAAIASTPSTIYVLGGEHSSILSSCEEFSSGSWAPLPAMRITRHSAAAAVVVTSSPQVCA